MANAIKRSNVEFSKRVFLDRLTVDAQPLAQPANIDAGPGVEYDYAGVGNSNDFGIGFDCSGLAGVVVALALFGADYFSGKGYFRIFTTETFPGPFQGFRKVNKAECLSSPSPIKVMIGHYGGGPYSHMAVWIDGWHMESNGDFGVCTTAPNITSLDSDYWNDWRVYDGTIEEDTLYRQLMGYPRVLDYAGGRIPGEILKAAGITAVCRYLYGAGTNLPFKQLDSNEAKDLLASGIEIVSNFESSTTRMCEGYSAGQADARSGLSVHRGCGGPDNAFIYFSCDYDEPEVDQSAVNEYCRGAANILGGPQHVGIYGAYYVCKRVLDSGWASKMWQTEAWSGFPDNPHVDSRVSLVQRNRIGYQILNGVTCDINEVHSADFGQWGLANQQPGPIITPGPAPLSDRDLWQQTWDQLRIEWPQLGNQTPVNALGEMRDKILGVKDYAKWKSGKDAIP